jgi:hypothetical protein
LFRHLFFAILLAVAFVLTLSLFLPAQTNQNSSATPDIKNQDISGQWQVAWTGRLGTEQCTLQIEQASGKLKGTLQDQRGSSQLSGTVDGTKVSFDVQFSGPHPFTTRFTGTVDADKMTGTSQAIGVGGAGAYLGHGGEIVQPEHPWTAKRLANLTNPAAETKAETKADTKATLNSSPKN